MTPILYEKDEIDFTSQGLGSLVEIYDVDVAEQRNGLLQLTASYPVTGVRYDDISVGRIILAKPNQRDEPHAFRITSTDLDIMGHNVMIEADSITYDLNHNIVKHLNVSGADGQTMMSALKNAIVNPSIFTFYSDITHVSSTSLDYVNPMEAVMGVKGSFLQIWGGELKRENRRVAMFNRRGRDNVATFRLGKNISGLKYKVDISSLVTRILPIKSVQENDTTTYLEGTPVSSQYINSYEQIYTIKVDFTDDTIKTVDDLNKASANWFVDSANTARDKPSVTIDIDVLSLQDSADYQDKFKDLESVALTDTVTVYVPEYGINVTAIVNELHFDPIQERVTKLTVGTAKMSFADSSRVQLSDLQDKFISVQEQANQTAISANGKNTNYYGSVAPSHPQAGDLWYWKNGDLSGIKQFINGEWVKFVDSDTQKEITDAVSKALVDAESTSKQIAANLDTKIQGQLTTVNGAIQTINGNLTTLDGKAQSYANKALSDAKADTVTQLAKALTTTHTELENAVSALDTKAQGYANAAKADAIAVANGSVAKEVTDRQRAINDLDKKTSDAVSAAKTDAQNAIDALQIGGRNYVLNSSGLNGSSTLRPALKGATTGSNATISYPEDGIMMTNGATNKTTEWYYQVASAWTPFPNTPLVAGSTYTFSADVMGTVPQVAMRWGFNGGTGGYESYKAFNINNTSWARVSVTMTSNATNTGLYFRIQGSINNQYTTGWTGGETLKFRNVKIEIGNKATDYTQAPEDIKSDYVARDDKITQTFTQYTQTNDGVVRAAQSTATQALNGLSTKVSQTDYNQKTGDLDEKYTTINQAVGTIKQDIVNIQKTDTDQSSKINTVSSDVDGTKQSISDIKKTQTSQTEKINTISSDVDGTKQDITDIKRDATTESGKLSSLSSTVNGLDGSFKSYVTSNDGRVSTAEGHIKANSDAILTKVSRTDYDKKTGQLQSDLNTTTNTANTAAENISKITSDNSKRDAAINDLKSTADETKRTISKLSGDLNTVSGDVSTLKQTAQGFEATVTKVDNMAVGGRNYVLNSNGFGNTNSKPFLTGSSADWSGPTVSFPGDGVLLTNPTAHTSGEWFYGIAAAWTPFTNTLLTPGNAFSFSVEVMGTVPQVALRWGFSGTAGIETFKTFNINNTSWTRVSIVAQSQPTNTGLYFRIQGAKDGSYKATWVGGETLKFRNVKIEDGNLPSGWSPAPEDVYSSISSVKQTADDASTAITKYKVSNDGRVSLAEGAIKTNADAITQKVSVVDYNANNGAVSTRIGKVETANDKITQSVSSLTTQVNNLKQVNLVNNSQMTPDYAGWHFDTPWDTRPVTTTQFGVNGVADATGAMYVWHDQSTSNSWLASDPIQVNPGQVVSISVSAAMPSAPSSGVPLALYMKFYDANKGQVGSLGYNVPLNQLSNTFTTFKYEKQVAPANSKYVAFFLGWNVGGRISFGKPMLVIGDTVGDYVPGQYNNNTKIATQQITIDSISDVVSNPITGLSKRVQTAEGTLSQVQGTDIPNLQKATFWQAPNGYDLNTYLTQGSFFFANTNARTNNPKNDNGWMYLVVEQANGGSRVTQTAWYDTVASARYTYKRQYASGAWSPWYANDNDSVTTISQTNEAIRTEISDRATGDTNTLTQAKDFTTSSISNSESGMRSQITQTSDAILGKVGAVNLFPNSEFENDYGYRDKNGSVTTLSLRAKLDVDGRLNGIVGVVSNTTAYQGYWARNIPVYGGQAYSASVLVHYINGGLSNGNALLDVWFIDKDGNKISKGTIGTGGSNVYSTGQVSSPYWVKLYIENVIAPTNAVYVQMSLIVNDAGAGQAATFTQPMLTATEKLQTYTPNNDITTQLALLKDNWSIGITSNTGAIASGIAANPNAMNIVSPKVIISSPETQITGTAWIKTAMIADGQISTAKIGDASITSAKIANLDVSKITGNVTNFIQSNWNGVYESTTITNNGMEIVTSEITTTFGPRGIKLTQVGESVGGIGVSNYVGMPTNFQGIAFNLDGTGDYMTWNARDSGVTTGEYTTKLSWFRSSYKPSGQNEGFNFSPDSPVTFWGNIYGRENTEPLKIASFGMQGISAGGIGHGNGSSAITFGGDGEIYIVSGGQYYKLAQLVKALQPLIGLGTWSAPTNIDSSGKVTRWTNITT